MKLKILILSFVFLNFFFSFSQKNIDYIGVIKLNDTSFISYKIVFNEINGIVHGYSITDLGGDHETKSLISGTYNDKKNTLTFKESGIVYTKSSIVENDFCYVNFTGKLNNNNEKKEISGSFKGLYNDGEECISGEIKMTSAVYFSNKMKKLDRKIDKNKLISKEKKNKINLVKELDSLALNTITKGETLNVFSNDKTIKLTIYDSGKEDGDRINLTVNGEIILNNFTITKVSKIIDIELKTKKTTIEVEALNVGTSAPNTVKIEITDTQNFTHTQSILNLGEKARIILVKN